MRRLSTTNTLHGIVEKYQSRIQELDDEKAELQGRIDKIRFVIGYVEDEPDEFVSVPQSGTFSEELTNYMYRTLVAHGPLHRSELLRRAQNAGIHIGGEDKLNNMTSYLSRNKKLFTSDGRGNWNVVAPPDESEEGDDDQTDSQDDEEAIPHLQLVR